LARPAAEGPVSEVNIAATDDTAFIHHTCAFYKGQVRIVLSSSLYKVLILQSA